MPIIVKDYTWIQSNTMVNIRIPVNKDAYHETVDVFTTDTYVKANFSPYLFEAFLLHDVDIKKSRCLVKDEVIVVDLLKREPIEWSSLEKELTKNEKNKLRQEILDKKIEEAQQEAEDKRVRRSQLDRFTVQRAMDIDAKQHEIMDSRKENEKSKAMNALEEWRLANEINPTPVDQISLPPFRSIPYQSQGDQRPNFGAKKTAKKNNKSLENISDPDGRVTEIIETKNEVAKLKSNVTITEIIEEESDVTPEPEYRKEDGDKKTQTKPAKDKKGLKWVPPPKGPPEPTKSPVFSEYVEKKKKELAKRVLPRLRETGTLEISHTPRTFPTPSRESSHEEEQTWLKNITLARRATGFVSEDLRPEEQDPEWCKVKGDEFFRSGNFLAAISAYSHGITLSDKLPSLYSNRSAAQFAIGNFNKCVQDCSTALELMKPACEMNRRSRAKCIARRGAALARLGYLHKGIDEMKAAGKLLPEDETIQKDIYDMERAWEQNPDDG